MILPRENAPEFDHNSFYRIFFLDFPREALQYSIRSHFSFHL